MRSAVTTKTEGTPSDNFKQTVRPRNRKLVTCTTCFKPGYIYYKQIRNHKYIYYIHYNEPPIGTVFLKGKPIRPKYRICYKFGRVYDSFDEKDRDHTNYKKLYWKIIEDLKDILYCSQNYSNKTKIIKIQASSK